MTVTEHCVVCEGALPGGLSALAHRPWRQALRGARLQASGWEPQALMVLLRWDLNGERFEEQVPLHLARRRRDELERLGAVVYWSERVAAAA